MFFRFISEHRKQAVRELRPGIRTEDGGRQIRPVHLPGLQQHQLQLRVRPLLRYRRSE